jgi:Rieske 2Fe-2S family protein
MAGLIYINFAGSPIDFEATAELMQPMARPQGFERARVAYSVDYDIPANWKIVWENNRECYHCDVNHPQYVKANFDRYDADTISERVAQQIEAATRRSAARWAAAGLTITHPHAGLAQFPDADRNLWYSANRTALADGYLTESIDGWQVASLMGDYTDPDVGTLRLRTLPNFWCHASCDHAVLTRLTPAGPRLTKARVIWLVQADAQSESDYTLDELLPFWQLTSEQDWVICENVQRGIDSTAFTPGPLSPSKEYNVDHFTRWYVRQLVDTESQPVGRRTVADLGEV